jgi:hypothetical protein
MKYSRQMKDKTNEPAGERDLAERLQRKGLLLVKAGHLSTRRLEPGLPGDGKNPANSVVAIRNEKEW